MTSESFTKTVESGAFIRTTLRRGSKRKQETKRFKPNDAKVVIGHLGDFEVYIYPYSFPDTVFIGSFPVSTELTANTLPEMLSIYNKARWFLQGFWQTEPEKSKAAKGRRQRILLAYNAGLEQLKKADSNRKNT